jgi:hypothetical protein
VLLKRSSCSDFMTLSAVAFFSFNTAERKVHSLAPSSFSLLLNLLKKAWWAELRWSNWLGSSTPLLFWLLWFGWEIFFAIQCHPRRGRLLAPGMVFLMRDKLSVMTACGAQG